MRAAAATVVLAVLLAVASPAGAEPSARPLATADDPTVFCDVDAGSWFAQAMRWAVSAGIVAGVDERRFDPLAPTTRGQIVTFLHRYVTWSDGSADPGHHSFTDVPHGAFYDAAVGWAVQTGVTGGLTATTFGPELATTREEFAAFVSRLHDAPTDWPVTSTFTDLRGSSFAGQISWMYDQGLTHGTSATTFGPAQTMTRAELVVFLWRMAGQPSPGEVPPTPRCPRTFTIIGDSVMRGAVRLGLLTPASFPGFTGTVSAVECRQALLEGIGCGWSTPIPSAWRVIAEANLGGTLGDIVVVHTSTNGTLDAATFDALVEAASPALEIWFVTVRRWYSQEEINAVIADGVERWSDRRSIGLLDWFALTQSRPGLVGGDDTHLTLEGARVFTELIGSAIR